MSEERRIAVFLTVADADIEAARTFARIANRNAAIVLIDGLVKAARVELPALKSGES
jgi:hypothetical protein